MATREFLGLLEFLKAFKAEEAIFFGGSFNPWHQGHKECLKLCPFPERTIVIPDHNPQKNFQPAVSAKSLESLRSDTEGLCFGIYDGFMEMNHSNPTFYWVEFLHQNRPALKLSLLLGADSFMNLQTWVEAEALLKLLTHLYVVPRLTDLDQLRAMKNELEKINHNLKISLLSSHQYEHLSSTEVRDRK